MKGRRIRYTAEQLAFVELRCAMRRRDLHAAFVAQFGRQDVTLDHIHGLCVRRRWLAGRQPWSAEHDALLRELYPDRSPQEIASRLGRSLSATYGRAQKLGLEKSEAYLASPAACRLRRGDHVGAAYRFEKGHAPANKGLRRPGWSAGRMKETQFTKGQSGWNWKPVGSERIVDGYRYTKVSDDRKVPWTRNWKLTHVLNWEALNGPIPKDHCLKSLDGNRQNVEPSNWKLISRSMLPRLSARTGRDYDNAPAELKPTIMAIAELEHTLRKKSPRKRTAHGLS